MVFQRRSSLGGILLAFVLLAILVNTLAVQTDSNDSNSIVPTSGMNDTARVNAESEKDNSEINDSKSFNDAPFDPDFENLSAADRAYELEFPKSQRCDKCYDYARQMFVAMRASKRNKAICGPFMARFLQRKSFCKWAAEDTQPFKHNQQFCELMIGSICKELGWYWPITGSKQIDAILANRPGSEMYLDSFCRSWVFCPVNDAVDSAPQHDDSPSKRPPEESFVADQK